MCLCVCRGGGGGVIPLNFVNAFQPQICLFYFHRFSYAFAHASESCITSACASRNKTQNVAPTINKQVLCWSLTLKCQIKGQVTPRRLNEENMERTSALVS